MNKTSKITTPGYISSWLVSNLFGWAGFGPHQLDPQSARNNYALPTNPLWFAVWQPCDVDGNSIRPDFAGLCDTYRLMG